MSNKLTFGVGVGVMIFDEGKILMGRRLVKGYDGCGRWALVGGNLEFGETPEQAAVREIKEETDLDAVGPEVFCFSNNIYEDCHYISIGLVVREWSGQVKNLEPEKCGELKWFDLDDLPENIWACSMQFIENFKAGRFYVPGTQGEK